MNDYSSIVKRVISTIPDEEDKEIVEAYFDELVSKNNRLEEKNRELERKNGFCTKAKATLMYVGAASILFDVIIVKIINYVTLLIDPTATPMKSEIGELVKIITPMFGIGV